MTSPLPFSSPASQAKACRHEGAAQRPDAGFCGQCGVTLLRCMSHEACEGFLDASGLCPACFAPQLYLDAGAVREVSAGGVLALPLLVANASPARRPVFITGLWSREGGDWESVDLVWDRLDAGAVQPALVRASGLDRPGAHQVEVLIAVTARWQWREEVFLFSTSLSVTAEGRQAITVNQTITNTAAENGFGSTTFAPIRIEAKEDSPARASVRPEPLPLTRATRAELQMGLRGQDGVRVLRDARLRWKGFGPGECPADGPITTRDGLLSFGRLRTRAMGGEIDARISLANPDGSLDVEGSQRLSRRHFDLSIENDRLMLHVESEAGVRIGDTDHPRGAVIALRHGDMVHPLRKSPARLALKVSFDTHSEGVAAITLTRTPTSPELLRS